MRGRKWNELEKQGQKKYVCVLQLYAFNLKQVYI